MSIQQFIPMRSLPIETQNVFEATFNSPAGQYGFTQNTANQNQTLLVTKKDYIYLIDRVSFSASIPEEDYLSSLGSGAILPTVRLKHSKQGGGYIYPRAFPAINYKDNLEFSFWFHSPQAGNIVQVDMFGVLNQIAATVGITTILAQLSYVVYQISNGTQVLKMLEKTGQAIGDFYSMGR